MHWIKVHRIPELGPASRGKAIVNLLELDREEKVAATVAVRELESGYLVFATENGTVKKTELAAFAHPRMGGIIAINVDQGDRLLDVKVTDGERELLLATGDGYAIRFPEQDARPMGRATRGVRGIRRRPGDRVVALVALDAEGDIMTVSEHGFGKRTGLEEYRQQSRGGKGIINLKVSGKTGRVIGVKQVRPEDGVILITQAGKLIRINVDGVSRIGRSTQGVKVMNLGEEDRVVAMAKLADREEEAGGDDPGAAADEDGMLEDPTRVDPSAGEPIN